MKKPLHTWSSNFQQRCQDNSRGRRESFQQLFMEQLDINIPK